MNINTILMGKQTDEREKERKKERNYNRIQTN